MELRNLKLSELKELAKSKGIHDAYRYKKDELLLKLIEIDNIDIKTTNDTETKRTEKADILENIEKTENKEEYKDEIELPEKIVEEIESSGTEAEKVTGILETHTDGYGFLRTHNYLTSDDDVYISPSQIRRFHMKTGDKISGITRSPKQGEKFKALLYVKEVNDENPELARNRKDFDSLIPIYPDERIKLETAHRDITMRIIDIIILSLFSLLFLERG